MRFALALCALLFAGPAAATTYKVKGVFNDISLGAGVTTTEVYGPIDVTAGPIVDAFLAENPFYSFLYKSSGLFSFDGSAFSNCSGMATLLCQGDFAFVRDGQFTSGRPDIFFLSFSDGSVSFGIDDLISFTFEGVGYFATGGVIAGGEATIAPVPIPASFFMFLTGLLALRRQTRMSTDAHI